MTNPYYSRGTSIIPFVLADARDVANELAAIEAGFDGVSTALTENRLASTSTTSLAIGTGPKTLLIQTGRAFSVGQFVSIARTADPVNFMSGQITSYNTSTGVLVVNATETGGSGTYNAWTVSLSIPGATANFVRKTGDTMSGALVLPGDPAADNEAVRKAYVDAVVTAAALLAKLVTVDGSGSGLDADLLDGLHAGAFAQLGGANFTGNINVVGAGGASAGLNTIGDVTANRGNSTGGFFFTGTGTRYLYFDGSVFNLVGGSFFSDGARVWTLANDGAGSGLDADLLDGLNSSAFVQTSGGTLSNVFRFGVAENQSIAARPSSETSLSVYGNGTGPAVATFHRPGSHAAFFGLDTDNRWKVGGWSMGGVAYDVWHAGNDGSGSGLDADLLDGLDSSYFVNIPARLGYTPLNQASYTAADVLSKIVTVDGAGSGLDADLLDGLNSSAFAQLSQSVVSADLADAIGYKGAPINAKTGAYTIVASDGGKVIPNTTGGFAVPTGLPQGFAVCLYNDSASPQSITTAGDTLRLAAVGSTGTRTVAGYSMATLVKVKSNEWLVQGAGVS